MSALNLDYQRSMKPFPVVGAMLLLLACAALFMTGQHYYRLTLQMSDWQTSLGMFERAANRQALVKPKRRELPEMMQEITQANRVLNQISLPWDQLFQAVESSVNQEVTLLGMEPDIERRTVRISCEAKNVAAMLNYIKQLEMRHEFGSVYLQSHQVQQSDPEKPVRFTLVAAWEIPA